MAKQPAWNQKTPHGVYPTGNTNYLAAGIRDGHLSQGKLTNVETLQEKGDRP